MPAPLRPEVLAPPQRSQIPPRRIADQHHVPSVPPVSPVGPTPRHVRLAPKRDAPVPAGTALDPDFRLVVHESKRVIRPLQTSSRPKRLPPRSVPARGRHFRRYGAEMTTAPRSALGSGSGVPSPSNLGGGISRVTTLKGVSIHGAGGASPRQ